MTDDTRRALPATCSNCAYAHEIIGVDARRSVVCAARVPLKLIHAPARANTCGAWRYK